MKRCLFFYLVILLFGLQAKSIVNHLDTRCSHIKPSVEGLDAAFVIRLHEKKDLSKLKQNLENNGIPLTEYNNFHDLSLEIMTKFCSTIISPYLLTQTLSHLSIYQYCLEHNLSNVLIVEDSAQLAANPQEIQQILKIKKINKKRKRKKRNKKNEDFNWDIIYTDVDYHDSVTGELIAPKLATVPNNKIKINDMLSKINLRYGTVAYIISKSGMKKILAHYQNKWGDLPYDQIYLKFQT